ncbi:MAG: nucleoside hydrolase [Planctomycetota bacterium]|jgi:inosine-uridine nucleoside N-ribohydrolase
MNGAKFLTGIHFRGFVLPIKSGWAVILLVLVLFLITLSSCTTGNNLLLSRSKKIPVIFDTDICGDIDDTWALITLLQSPELDIKLITTAVGDTPAKAKTVAKILEIAGRSDIPVGIGVQHNSNGHRQDRWVEDYELSSYPGRVYKDGVQALIDTVMNSPQPITLIAVGPLPNIAAALQRQRRIAEKAKFVGMHGSIRLGYDGKVPVSAEYNVKAFAKEAQKVFTADWDMTITPLDTCGLVQLKGEKYQKVLKRNSRLTRALIENYHLWLKPWVLNKHKDLDEDAVNAKINEKLNTSSTTLFDTVAIYLVISTELVQMEKLGIRVTNDGYTVIDDNARVINCATRWKNLGAFEDFLVKRLTK